MHRLLNGASKDEDIQSVVNWVTKGQGVARSLADANAYGDRAREALYHFPASHNRDVLDELIDFVVSRRH